MDIHDHIWLTRDAIYQFYYMSTVIERDSGMIQDRLKLLARVRFRVLSGLPITYAKAVVIVFLLPSTSWSVVDVYNRGVVVPSSSR